ncbi:hypothetical protein H9L13_05190 [Sphingomonas lutea]|uniref:Uncharacterized protein n=1 Tax=Sphingomonas lutea TaxID=1045317 RepID=A0A7G9SK94_9SPHN|nr:hypothetical protein [Sphingomonas lutea]QNN68269.1 hypothetical protein H9L13_05190 [Sphingomonas lutea]
MNMKMILAGTAGLAALATAAPATAQYGYYAQPYGYTPQYGYAQQYGYGYNTTALASQRCTAAVQARLQNRVGIQSILGAVLGVNTSGRVLSVTQVTPRRNDVRVRGLASSGRQAGYGPYGVGAYGAYGYGFQPDLSFNCRVDYNGYVRDVNINRR